MTDTGRNVSCSSKMAFHGDFSSFALPELLQWLDSSRKSGSLQMGWDAGERKLFLEAGQVVATSGQGLWERVARMLSLSALANGEAVFAALAEMRRGGEPEAPFRSRKLQLSMPVELAREELFGAVADLTAAQGGEFHWSEDDDRGDDEWVPVAVGLRQLLFESLRWVDEQPDVDRALPSDSMTVRALVPPAAGMPLLHRVILTFCVRGASVGKLRLAMGVSRSAVARRVYDLMRLKMVSVEGAPDLRVDPITEMLEKGSVLVRERQFEAAGLVFSALLASDPADRRVREFARMVEREHVAALYREMPPVLIPELVDEPELLTRLRPEERHIASILNGRWDISTIVLA
ncbi:MAG TPA: DUF4388 domain-containing protein, partial [Myxococcaceae bacterium]|nr:DUF4388 domain-containing protein [Myxococcaceae bacterium]